jgi:hypothetical protein
LSLVVSDHKGEEKKEEKKEKGESLKRSLFIHTFLTLAYSFSNCVALLVFLFFSGDALKGLF